MTRPRLIAFSGLPGVGKSTASEYAADRLSAPRYRSDEVRKELFAEPTYSASETAATYDELLSRARQDLVQGRDAVVDATFGSRRHRDAAARTAREADAAVLFVRVTCPSEVVRERIERRDDVSDADFEIHLQLRDEFDPFERDHVEIDNAGNTEETCGQIDRLVL